MNCNTCSLTPTFNYISNYYKLISNKINVKTNTDALIYMISNEKKYAKIIQTVNNAARYNNENKRYYSIFNGKSMDSRDIYLAKNRINTYEKYKCYIKYKLYQEGYTKGKKIVINNCSNEANTLVKYNRLLGNNTKLCNKGCTINYKSYGYNNINNNKVNKYINKYDKYNKNNNECNKCFTGVYLNESYFSKEKEELFNTFLNTYQEALYYGSYVRNKIEYIKTSSLKAKTTNLTLIVNKIYNFINLPPTENKKTYSGQAILGIYNSILQRMN